MKINHIY